MLTQCKEGPRSENSKCCDRWWHKSNSYTNENVWIVLHLEKKKTILKKDEVNCEVKIKN